MALVQRPAGATLGGGVISSHCERLRGSGVREESLRGCGRMPTDCLLAGRGRGSSPACRTSAGAAPAVEEDRSEVRGQLHADLLPHTTLDYLVSMNITQPRLEHTVISCELNGWQIDQSFVACRSRPTYVLYVGRRDRLLVHVDRTLRDDDDVQPLAQLAFLQSRSTVTRSLDHNALARPRRVRSTAMRSLDRDAFARPRRVRSTATRSLNRDTDTAAATWTLRLGGQHIGSSRYNYN